MKIDKFSKSEFGSLTTITNEKTGITMFVGKEIADMWGHSNLTQCLKNASIEKTEYRIIELKKFPEFKKQLTKSHLVGYRTSNVTLITESAMYKMALNSNLEKAQPFKNWVASEILPSIRKKGYYSLVDQQSALMIHSNTDIQKNNSKAINTKNFIEHGLESVIDYNRTSCILHTGKTPSEIKEIGKQKGLKSIDRSSAKEVLRHTQPELACAMSFTDSMVKKGFDLKTVSELSIKAAVPLFKGMLELGITPMELNQ
jgi:prophage antirepressor-like protein